MVDLKTTYTLILNEDEGRALKRLLGSMNDNEFAQHGIKGVDIETMSEIWDVLPYDEEEE